MKTFKEIFDTVLTGDKDDSRIAAREVRKLLYASRGGKREEIFSIISGAPATYSKITDNFRQENFVMSISVMYFLHNREDRPDFLFPWFFQLLQHNNGNIRYAVVRMIETELGPLTCHIRFPSKKFGHSKVSPAEADKILFGLRTNLENLSIGSYKPFYKKYKYIDSLPSGTYKSVQQVLCCLEDYCSDVYETTDDESNKEILLRRIEIEQEFTDILKKTGSNFTLEHIKEIIYNEEGPDDLADIIAVFDNGQDEVELDGILELVSDAWNFFPHQNIGGFSPAEKLLKHKKAKPGYNE
jgi:hypothetical protein